VERGLRDAPGFQHLSGAARLSKPSRRAIKEYGEISDFGRRLHSIAFKKCNSWRNFSRAKFAKAKSANF
jgi:hypothetical protein